ASALSFVSRGIRVMSQDDYAVSRDAFHMGRIYTPTTGVIPMTEPQEKPKKPIFKKVWFWIIVIVAVIIVSVAATRDDSSADATTPTTTATTDGATTPTEAATTDGATTVPAETQPATQTKETTSQKQAVRKAASYLKTSAFSRQGLIDQLVFEGFSNEDAIYGVDAQNADWSAQAAKKAESYLEITAFSRQGLIDQLIFEDFTQEQAEYGVAQAGL
ncbi:MAG: Ltp family lipoprotein, partial [Propionibacteriaceae bacterium]|nr:Ltp family lipoprotein [Propionibacteriaceae bacterium]